MRERPGITVAELATELSVDATGLYGVVRRLQSEGQIRKEGTRLQPVEGHDADNGCLRNVIVRAGLRLAGSEPRTAS